MRVFPYTLDGINRNVVVLYATAKYKIIEKLAIGADLGYAFIFTEDDHHDAFYYQPKTLYTLGEKSQIWVGYSSINKLYADAVNVGYNFSFGVDKLN